MTKKQLSNALVELAAGYKVPKEFIEKMNKTLDEFNSRANRDAEKREKFITVDGKDYQWCLRHQVYEPVTNFKPNSKYSDCKLAMKSWAAKGKVVAKLQKELLEKAAAGEDVQEVAQNLKEAKELRAGRYNQEDDWNQFQSDESLSDYILEGLTDEEVAG